MKQVASLRYGVIFKKAFCDPEIFKGFVRDILGIQLEIDMVETEKTFSIPIGRVQPRVDLFAEDKKNRVIVDIQHERYADHYDRFLHYHCVALLEQINQSQDYRPQLKVFTIVVLTSGDRHKKDVSFIKFDPHDLAGQPLNEIHHQIIYLCPKYWSDKTPLAYQEWLRAIEDSLDEQVEETQYQLPEIHKIFHHIEKDLISPQERARMIEEYHLDELKQDQFAEGWETGVKQGIMKRNIEIAKKLLVEGTSPEVIAKITDLTAEEIQALSQLSS